MGVYIKGMEMPKSCAVCRFNEGGWCFGMSKTNRQPIVFPNMVARWCPLVAVPDHGDLIDRDEAEKVIHDEWDDVCVWDESGETTAIEVCGNLHQVPVIIPAERSEQ